MSGELGLGDKAVPDQNGRVKPTASHTPEFSSKEQTTLRKMSEWSCAYCTLRNDPAAKNCGGCGSLNPARQGQKSSSFLPKFLTKSVAGLSNALLDAFSPPSRPQHQFVYVDQDLMKPPIPQGPLINGNKSKPPPVPPRPAYDNVPSTSGCEIDGDVETPSTGLRKGVGRVVGQLKNELGLEKEVDFSMGKKAGNSSFCAPSRHMQRLEAPEEADSQHSPSSSMCSEVTEHVQRTLHRRADKVFDDIVNQCKAQRRDFVDTDFPHNDKSIGQLDRGRESQSAPRQFIWLRPDAIYTKDGRALRWSVFNDPRSSDIEQGSLGDCWLISAMALLAERPDLLVDIFLTKQYNEQGVYQLRLCVDGEWKVIVVDDYFPCRPDMSLAFAVGRNNQLWVPLLEKALAKAFGSYAALTAGHTCEGLAFMTGASCETLIISDDEDMVWAVLLSAREAGYIMGCSCGSGNRQCQDQAQFKAMGLVPQHAYSILDVVQEGRHRILRLRNPWGSTVWKGDWSDRWNGWPRGLQARLEARVSIDENRGSFWIAFHDFVKYFNSADIAKVHPISRYSEMRLPVEIGGRFSETDLALLLIATEPTEITATIFQKGARRVQDMKDIIVCIHKFDENDQLGDLVVASPRKIAAFTGTGDIFLPPGQYLAVGHSLATLGERKVGGSLVIHSSKPMFGEPVYCPPEMRTESLQLLIIGNGTYVTDRNEQSYAIRHLNHNFAGVVIMAENYTPDRWLHLRVDCTNSRNILSSRDGLCVADVIPPLQRQIIIVLTQFEPTSGYSTSTQFQMSMSGKLGLGDMAVPDHNGRVNPTASHTPEFSSKEQTTLHKALNILR